MTTSGIFHEMIREKWYNSEKIAEKTEIAVILMNAFVGKAFHYRCSKCAKGQSNKCKYILFFLWSNAQCHLSFIFSSKNTMIQTQMVFAVIGWQMFSYPWDYAVKCNAFIAGLCKIQSILSSINRKGSWRVSVPPRRRIALRSQGPY